MIITKGFREKNRYSSAETLTSFASWKRNIYKEIVTLRQSTIVKFE